MPSSWIPLSFYGKNNKPIKPPGSNPKFINHNDFLLHEYDALRSEIVQRVTTKYQIISIVITALGIVLAIGNVYLAILFPALAFVLLTVYISNSHEIRKISVFIQKNIETQVTEDGESQITDKNKISEFGWEKYQEDAKLEKIAKAGYSGGKAIFCISSLISSVVSLFLSISQRAWIGYAIISILVSL